MMEKLAIAGLVFESIKQNWAKSGSFQSLVEIVCQRLDIPFDEEICEFLKKSDALWLNNHLDVPGDDAPEDQTELDQVKSDTGEPIKKIVKVVQAHTDKKNHDFH